MSTRCAVCDGEELRPRFSVERSNGASLVATTTCYGVAPADIVRCVVCGHMQVAELPDEAELAGAYEEVGEDAYLDEERGQRATARRALERIELHTPKRRGALLDLGCGVGFLVSEAEDRGWEATGVEPSSFAARLARERFGLNVVRGTLEQALLPESHFQAVVLGDVIEHVPDPGSALDRIRRLLVHGGVVYLALPDAGSAMARLLRRRWWSVLPTHVQYFTRASMTCLLARQRYAVEWMGTAPKAFSVRYYLRRLEGYSKPLADAAVAIAERTSLSERLVWPDFRDRMAVVARLEA